MPFAEEHAAQPRQPNNEGDDEPTRVLVVEDHRVVAEGLTALINDQADMRVVGNVGSVADCVRAATELNPDIVLLDFRLPDGSGPDKALKATFNARTKLAARLKRDR